MVLKNPSFSVPLDPEEDEILFDFLHVEIWGRIYFPKMISSGLVSVSRLDAVTFPSPGVPHYLTRRPGMSRTRRRRLRGTQPGLPTSPLVWPSRRGAAHPVYAVGRAWRPAAAGAEVTGAILRAGNLLRTDLIGGADPFVIVRRNGKVIGQTKTKFDTLHLTGKMNIFSTSVLLNHKGLLRTSRTYDSRSGTRISSSKTLMGLVPFAAGMIW